jgi:hypothetical protein
MPPHHRNSAGQDRRDEIEERPIAFDMSV